MFTGLIQAVGTVKANTPKGQGRELQVDVSGLTRPPTLGASIAVSGACLTVTALQGGIASFDAVSETASRTLVSTFSPGARVNLEPALCMGDPLDGHLVSGHVDDTAKILEIRALPESWVFRIALPAALVPLVATKGSVTVDGISLTVVEANREWFSLSVIPHTYKETTLADRKVGDAVNLEADLLARYVARIAEIGQSGMTESFLREHGF